MIFLEKFSNNFFGLLFGEFGKNFVKSSQIPTFAKSTTSVCKIRQKVNQITSIAEFFEKNRQINLWINMAINFPTPGTSKWNDLCKVYTAGAIPIMEETPNGWVQTGMEPGPGFYEKAECLAERFRLKQVAKAASEVANNMANSVNEAVTEKPIIPGTIVEGPPAMNPPTPGFEDGLFGGFWNRFGMVVGGFLFCLLVLGLAFLFEWFGCRRRVRAGFRWLSSRFQGAIQRQTHVSGEGGEHSQTIGKSPVPASPDARALGAEAAAASIQVEEEEEEEEPGVEITEISIDMPEALDVEVLEAVDADVLEAVEVDVRPPIEGPRAPEGLTGPPATPAIQLDLSDDRILRRSAARGPNNIFSRRGQQ